jgi:hypothetical protein
MLYKGMKNIFLLFCSIAGLLLISSSSSETALRVLYDPRISSKKSKANPSDLARVQKAFTTNRKSLGKEFQRQSEYCYGPPGGELVGAFTGSFTKPKVKQSGYALVFCERIIVIGFLENAKLTALAVFSPKGNFNLCGFGEVYAVRDINRNELSEFAMTMGCGDGPWSEKSLLLYESRKSTLTLICGDIVQYGFGDSITNEYWEKIVYVNPQPKPLFVAQKLLLKNPKDWDSRPLILSDQMTTFCDEKPSGDSFEISVIRF